MTTQEVIKIYSEFEVDGGAVVLKPPYGNLLTEKVGENLVHILFGEITYYGYAKPYVEAIKRKSPSLGLDRASYLEFLSEAKRRFNSVLNAASGDLLTCELSLSVLTTWS